MVAVGLALLSLVFAAANDIVFKRFATKRSHLIGLYMAGIGVVWASIFAAIMLFSESEVSWGATLLWGLVSGGFSALANVLLIEGMAKLEAGVCSTIYRLNLVPAAIIAIFLLNENISIWKGLGILAAILAVFLFSSPNKQKNAGNIGIIGFAIIIFASLLRAGMGLSYKYGLNSGADEFAILALNGVMWIIVGVAYDLIGKTPRKKFDAGVLKYSLLSGVLICGITVFMMFALKYGQASLVIPISQLSFVLTATAAVLFFAESVTLRKISGLAIAILCIIFMAVSNG